jgi:hypothetical protein
MTETPSPAPATVAHPAALSASLALARAAVEPHTCGAPNCVTETPGDTFLCEAHSNMLVPSLRHVVRDSYEPGQAVSANRYLAAAIDAIAHKQKRAKPNPVPGARKPIQLALFDV